MTIPVGIEEQTLKQHPAIPVYDDKGGYAGWTQAYARQAVRFETRLEKALEGERFFDLVRWGIVEETMNIIRSRLTNINFPVICMNRIRDMEVFNDLIK